jgi:hypothetical protein
MIELMLYLACTLGSCHVAPLMVTPEAVAVASCESGDTVTLMAKHRDALPVTGGTA